MQNNKWQCYWSKTLGPLEDTHQKIWGTKDYENDTDPTVFFGCYGLPDFYTLWRHKGRKCVLWAGTDIQHFIHGYWLDTEGRIRIGSGSLARWINTYCENYVENGREQEVLKQYGIDSKIVPSFLGDIDKFEVSFKPGNKVYASVSGDNFEQYGWDKIKELATKFPLCEFHLYGNIKEWSCENKNVVVHGRVPKDRMNLEIKRMQGALRLTRFDGASEIIVKAMLMGQYAFSFIEYPFVNRVEDLGILLDKKEPNIEGREWWRDNLNLYPWNNNAKRNTEKWSKQGLV